MVTTGMLGEEGELGHWGTPISTSWSVLEREGRGEVRMVGPVSTALEGQPGEREGGGERGGGKGKERKGRERV